MSRIAGSRQMRKMKFSGQCVGAVVAFIACYFFASASAVAAPPTRVSLERLTAPGCDAACLKYARSDLKQQEKRLLRGIADNLMPRDAWYDWRQRTTQHIQIGDFAAARQDLTTIGSLIDRNSEGAEHALYLAQWFDLRGRLNHVTGDLDGAYRDYREAFRQTFSFEDWAAYRMEAVYSMIDDAETLDERIATNALAAEKQAHPAAMAAFNEGVSRMSAKNLKGALASFDTAIATSPDFAYYWLARARLKGDLDDAAGDVANARKALSLYKGTNSGEFHLELGLALAVTEKLDEGIAEVREAVIAAPWRTKYRSAFQKLLGLQEQVKHPTAYVLQQSAAKKIADKDFAGAVADLDKAIAGSPSFGAYHHDRGLARFKLAGAGQAVEDDLAKAVNDSPDAVDLRLDYGSYLYNGPNPMRAKSVLYYVLRLEPRNADATKMFDVLQARQDKDDDASAATAGQRYQAEIAKAVTEKEAREHREWCAAVILSANDPSCR